MRGAPKATNALPRGRKPFEHPRATQALLIGYTGFAFLAATFFSWSEPYTGVFQYASVAFYVAAGAISLLVGLLLARGSGGLRRTVIGFEILLIPLQLATSVRSNVPLIGVVLSIAILVLLRPAFPKLSKQSRKFFLTLHVGLAVSWLGAATAMAVLSVTGLVTEVTNCATTPMPSCTSSTWRS